VYLGRLDTYKKLTTAGWKGLEMWAYLSEISYLASRNQLNESQLLQRLHLQSSRIVPRTRHTDLKELFRLFPSLERSERDTSCVMIRQVIRVM